MFRSAAKNPDTPRKKFELHVHDDDTKAAFRKRDPNARRDKGPPMDSPYQPESSNYPHEVGVDRDFLDSLPDLRCK